jgi:hypothetical protein
MYYLVVWAFIRREIPLIWTASNKKMILAATAAALIVRILPSTRFANFRTPVGLALALIAAIPSLFLISREFLIPKEMETGIRPTDLTNQPVVTSEGPTSSN